METTFLGIYRGWVLINNFHEEKHMSEADSADNDDVTKTVENETSVDEFDQYDWWKYDLSTFEDAPTIWLKRALQDRLAYVLFCVKNIDPEGDYGSLSFLYDMNPYFGGIFETAPEIMELQDILCRRADPRRERSRLKPGVRWAIPGLGRADNSRRQN